MFGVRKKVYYIFALISGAIGVLVLGLKVFGILPNEQTYTLISLIFLMLGFVLYIRPAIKIMTLKMELCQRYRNDLYNELMKDNKFDNYLKFHQNEQGEIEYKKFKFTGLTFKEAEIILVMLLNDYVKIIFGVMDDKKKKFIKANIESFKIELIMNDNKILYKEFIKDYNFIK